MSLARNNKRICVVVVRKKWSLTRCTVRRPQRLLFGGAPQLPPNEKSAKKRTYCTGYDRPHTRDKKRGLGVYTGVPFSHRWKTIATNKKFFRCISPTRLRQHGGRTSWKFLAPRVGEHVKLESLARVWSYKTGGRKPRTDVSTLWCVQGTGPNS